MNIIPGMKIYRDAEGGGAGGGEGDGEGEGELILGKYKDVEALSEAYKNLEGKLGKTDEQLRADISAEFQAAAKEGVPENIDGYEVTLPDGVVPEGLDFKLDAEDPMLAEFKTWAHENGIKGEIFQGLLGFYAKSQIGMMPDIAGETAKLGENGQARIERVDLWAGKNLSESTYNTMMKYTDNADMIVALEEVMKKSSGDMAPAPGDGDDGGHQPLSRLELETMMQDPKYRDPRHRDEDFVKRVTAGFQALDTKK